MQDGRYAGLVIQVSDPEAEICWITQAAADLHAWTAPGALTACSVPPTPIGSKACLPGMLPILRLNASA